MATSDVSARCRTRHSRVEPRTGGEVTSASAAFTFSCKDANCSPHALLAQRRRGDAAKAPPHHHAEHRRASGKSAQKREACDLVAELGVGALEALHLALQPIALPRELLELRPRRRQIRPHRLQLRAQLRVLVLQRLDLHPSPPSVTPPCELQLPGA
eukprot:1289626-Rhodomonas_salina.1